MIRGFLLAIGALSAVFLSQAYLVLENPPLRQQLAAWDERMIDNHLVCQVLERLIDARSADDAKRGQRSWLPPSAAIGICRAEIRIRPFSVRAVGSMARSE